MKTERRHELHTNVLADWLGDHIERVRPYSRVILGAVLVVVVGMLLYGYMNVQSARTSETSWQDYFQATNALNMRGDAEKLVQLADSPVTGHTAVGYWAKLSMGDYSLNRGIDEMFNDRLSGRKSLEAALAYYTQVARQSHQPMLADRATLGMGRAYESLNELDQARTKYNQLAKAAGPFSAEAQQRLADLERDPTKRFYDWFSTAKLPRQKFEGFGLPGDRPSFGNMPDEQLFKSPGTDDDKLLNTPAGGAKGAAGADDSSFKILDFGTGKESATEKALSVDEPAASVPPTESEKPAEAQPPVEAPKSNS